MRCATLPPEKIRHHTCYGINMGPRIHDMELKDIVDIILKIRAGAYSFEAANPRHEHEWKVWETAKLPDGKSLIPGVISHSTVLVEHPELVAERIGRYAKVVGRENVIAGADCGFATFAGSKEVHPSIVWAKFKSLVEGARIASRQLWAGIEGSSALDERTRTIPITIGWRPRLSAAASRAAPSRGGFRGPVPRSGS